jgi:hypothetical protein
MVDYHRGAWTGDFSRLLFDSALCEAYAYSAICAG